MVAPSKEQPADAPKRIGGVNIMHVMYSFVKKLGTVALVYALGYMEFSIAWLIGPIVLSVIRDEWKKEKELQRNIAKASALCQEKEVILARVDELPSWVFFPDVERVEWVNKILRQVWPNVNHYAKDILKNTIEPSIRESLVAYHLNGFHFEKMVLGSIPLRIGGVKVYDQNVPRDQIILDMDVSYAGDCDISFSIGGIKGGIKDLQIQGNVRTVMRPLISTVPLIGGLQVFFLRHPTIDFNLVGVADVLDMPGLSDLLRRIVVEAVGNIMVLPNKIAITLSDAVPALSLKMPDPEGVVRIHVVEAKNLMKKDMKMLGMGKSDPYCIVSIGGKTFRTQTIDNTLNPKWDFWCEAKITSQKAQMLSFELWDWDPGFPGIENDDFLGRATVELSQVTKKGKVGMWLTLEGAKRGMVHVRMTWLTLSKDKNDLAAALQETQMLRVTSMSTAVLVVFVDSVKNLPKARTTSLPDPYVTLTVGNTTEQTASQFRTVHPVWEQGFTFLVSNPENDTLYIKAIDSKTTQELGVFVYNVSTLLQKMDMEVEKQPFSLSKSGPESTIYLAMHLRILKYEEKDTNEEDEEEPTEGGDTETDTATAPLLDKRSPTQLSEGSESSVEASPAKEPAVKTELDRTESMKSATEEIIIPAAASPGVQTSPDLRQRSPSATSSAGEYNLGRIQLTLRYSQQRQRLIVVVHRVVNLPLKDPNSIPDPYVKLYLLPERSKDSKRKTDTLKDNCNPVYDETFEYLISQADMRNRQLEVSVVTRKGFLQQSPTMGQVVLDLKNMDLNEAKTMWLDLCPETSREA
ncbi:extended synaptotagmin-2-B isoform X1 [Schistocerca gregaria]|uniref:extended synaptotagmin-2-B isoform X1 n=1 Tax=Schistocerca gregaria TaxID=7010 RepID=UPI00211ED544|nr:extended synaptotagmin-2-B isoform X1 [Schistocerca gregaria]